MYSKNSKVVDQEQDLDIEEQDIKNTVSIFHTFLDQDSILKNCKLHSTNTNRLVVPPVNN